MSAIRKGPSGPLDNVPDTTGNAGAVPVVNDAGTDWDMVAPGPAGSVFVSDGERWTRGEPSSRVLGMIAARGLADANVYGYTQAQIDGDEDASAPAFTWNLSGLSASWRANQLCVMPDGRILVGGAGGGAGRIYEIAANAPLVSGVPPFREVFTLSAGAVSGVGFNVFGDVIASASIAGDDAAYKLAPEFVGWPQAALTNAVQYTAPGTDLFGNEMVADPANAGFMWNVKFTGNNVTRWDMTGPAGALAPLVTLSGSNWSGSSGIAIDALGVLAVANYNADQLQMLAGPFATGNPAPTRTMTSASALDQGCNSVVFARNGDPWIGYFDSSTLCRFSAAQYAAGGAQSPARRITFPFSALNCIRLGNGLGVRR
jgi:hypothetical protein